MSTTPDKKEATMTMDAEVVTMLLEMVRQVSVPIARARAGARLLDTVHAAARSLDIPVDPPK